MSGPAFFAELKRRNVFRAGATYAVLAWVVMQVADIVLPAFSAPEWVLRVVLFFLIVAFPLVLIVSWIYELTPEGFKRTNDVDPALSIRSETGQKLNYITIGSVVLLLLVTLIDRNLPEAEVAAPPIADTPSVIPAQVEPALTITDKSIAVLPLDDFNAGGEEEYFADGLTEEILTALSRTPDLLVSSRTSSFQYKDQAINIQDVAQALGVAHVLEGSVRRSADRLRVTVQLIRASDGFHLWSENYDRTPDDIIAVQEDIAFQIATALQTAMDPEALRQMVQAGTRSVAAYNAYLKGLSIRQGATTESPREAYAYFEEARQADSLFAAAHFHAARFWKLQLTPTTMGSALSSQGESVDQMLALYQERINAAIENSPPPEQYLYRADQAHVNLQFKAALDYLQQFIAARPSGSLTGSEAVSAALSIAKMLGDTAFISAMVDLMTSSAIGDAQNHMIIMGAYWSSGRFVEAREFALAAVEKYPFDQDVLSSAYRLLLESGYYDEARAILARINGTKLQPGNFALAKLRQACADNDLEEANRLLAAGFSDPDGSLLWIALQTLNRKDEADAMLKPLDQGNLFSLSTFLTYPYFDVTQFPNLQQVLEREQVDRPPHRPPPYACGR